MTEEELNQLINDFECLFHKVLQRCHVFVCNNDYEDFLQVLRESFFLYAKDFSSRAAFDQEFQMGFLFQRLCWKTVDTQRKQARYQAIVEQVKQWYIDKDASTIEEWPLYFDDLWKVLTEREQQLVEALVIKGWTMTDTAGYLMISRDTLYRWRNNLKKKLEQLEMKGK